VVRPLRDFCTAVQIPQIMQNLLVPNTYQFDIPHPLWRYSCSLVGTNPMNREKLWLRVMNSAKTWPICLLTNTASSMFISLVITDSDVLELCRLGH
jgi:hypothetical protein